ncbi:hypothetical protein BVC80_8875g3 [Macleaya cordata]|uniref:Uncharacterized protein n=1 Tax=Macleaya cordata TaxID=56857 RepID=A0A200Q3A3_MACCD|nr:hypothetical protein BVC80_8875g3 [Macleaya cordata]
MELPKSESHDDDDGSYCVDLAAPDESYHIPFPSSFLPNHSPSKVLAPSATRSERRIECEKDIQCAMELPNSEASSSKLDVCSYSIDYGCDSDYFCKIEFPPTAEEFLALPPDWSPTKALAPYFRQCGVGKEWETDILMAVELENEAASKLDKKSKKSNKNFVTEEELFSRLGTRIKLDDEGSYCIDYHSAGDYFRTPALPPTAEEFLTLPPDWSPSQSKVSPSVQMETSYNDIDGCCTPKCKRNRIT